MHQILIYTENSSPRLAYVLNFLKKYCKNSEWAITNSSEEFIKHPGIKINYSKIEFQKEIYNIYYSGFLTKELSAFIDIPVRNKAEALQLFPGKKVDEFDFFAATFYLLARIEEYLPFNPDKHQRFPATASLLYKNHALQYPLIDIWIHDLINKLQNKYSITIETENIFPNWSIGIDIDQFFKYKHKSIIKSSGGIIKYFVQGKFQQAIIRMKVWLALQKDPFDVYDEIAALNIEKAQLLFFILSGGQSEFDKNHLLNLPVIRNILNKLKKK